MTTPSANGAGPVDVALLQLRQQLDQLQAENLATFAALKAQHIVPDLISLVESKVDSLVDSIAEVSGMGQHFQLLAHVRFQQKLKEQLAVAQKEGTKAVLGSGSLLSAAQINELARETGTPGWQRGRLQPMGQDPAAAPGHLGVRTGRLPDPGSGRRVPQPGRRVRGPRYVP